MLDLLQVSHLEDVFKVLHLLLVHQDGGIGAASRRGHFLVVA